MTIRPTAASAPGKVILMGEHAVVYGVPAIVASVGLRTEARVEPAVEAGVELDLPAIGHRETTTWREILEHARVSRTAWTEYAAQPSAESFARVRVDDPAHLVKVALGETAAALDLDSPPALRLTVVSEIPVGAGFGSSAATAVAVIGALLTALGETAEEDRVDRLALEVERRQHGQPSGVDHKTALLGGILRFDRPDGGELDWRPVVAVSPGIDKLALFHTGEPAQSTGEVVAAVRERREADPEGFAVLLGRMRQAVEGFDAALRQVTGGLDAMRSSIREYQNCLEELGVVPDAVREAVRAIGAKGGNAKISGAGALSGDAAGCLLVHWTDEDPAGWSELAAFRHFPVRLGVAGIDLRIESGGR